METFLELQNAVRSDLNVSENSSLFPLETIKSAINRAYIKAHRLYRFPASEDAKHTTTQENEYYYDAPEDWTPDSIWHLEVDGVQYGKDPDGSPMTFKDFLKWKADNPNSTEKRWAKQWMRYFISPTPSIAGLTICIYGQKNAAKLVENTDETIFSNNLPECNEAIVLEAVAILKKKGESEKLGEMLSLEAKQILTIAYNQVKSEEGIEDKEQPMFEVPDLYGGANQTQVTSNFISQR